MPTSKMVKVSSKGQIVLPKSFRDRAGISDGDYIFIEEIDGILLIEKPMPSRLSQLTERLRNDAGNSNFSRQDLKDAIAEIRTQQSVESYSLERIAEFILSNAIDANDYESAVEEVRLMGLDPDSISHTKPD